MNQSLNIQDTWVAEQIWRLQHIAYYVEASLIGMKELPPLTDTISALQNSGELFYGTIMDEEVIAALACKQDEETMMIRRLMVHPSYFRQGVASALLSFVESIAFGVRMFTVETVTANIPAVRLYESLGYSAYSEHETPYGIQLTEFRKIVG
jgi:ribosomal protein S18 acetylase RimI-like enzyme